MICIDAFDNDGVPVQFVTPELIAQAHRLLRPNGMLVLNTWVVHDLVSYGCVRKCLAEFGVVESFITRDKLNRVVITQKDPGNTILNSDTLETLELMSQIPFRSVAHEEFEQRLPRVS